MRSKALNALKATVGPCLGYYALPEAAKALDKLARIAKRTPARSQVLKEATTPAEGAQNLLHLFTLLRLEEAELGHRRSTSLSLGE